MNNFSIKSLKHIVVFLTLLLSGCSINAQKNEATTSAKQFSGEEDFWVVPDEFINVIENSDSVVWYILDAFSETPDTTLMIGGGEVLNSKVDSLTDRVDALASMLTNNESFPKSDHIKESTFLPDMAMKFTHETETIVVAYSFYCDLCRFQKGHIYRDYDGELIRKHLLQLALEVFPNERFLRDLNRREK
jgi:outer membrane murein-binding lipoprotein Lpp